MIDNSLTLLLVGLTITTALNSSDFVIGFGAVFKKTGTALFVLDDDGSVEIQLNIISIYIPLTAIIVSMDTCGHVLQELNRRQHCQPIYTARAMLKELMTLAKTENSSLNDYFLGASVEQRLVANANKKHYHSMNVSRDELMARMIMSFIKEAENRAQSLSTTQSSYLSCESLEKPLLDIISLYSNSLNGIQLMITFFKMHFSLFLKKGKISQMLVNETELLRYLSGSRIYDNKLTIIPYAQKTVKHYYHLSKATDIRIHNGNNRYIYFKLQTPVKADINFYDVYQIIPMYMSQGNIGFGVKLPQLQYNYIAESRNGFWITFINDFKTDCTMVPNYGYSLCPVKYVFLSNLNKNCIIGSFLKNDFFNENCNVLTSETFTPQFINVDHNRWVYSFRDTDEMLLTQICRDPMSQAETKNGSVNILPGVGVFSFKKQCYGNGQLGTDIYTFKSYNSRVYGNEFKYLMFDIITRNIKANSYYLQHNIVIIIYSVILALNWLTMGLMVGWIKQKNKTNRNQHSQTPPPPPPPSPSLPPPPPPPPLVSSPPYIFQQISSNSNEPWERGQAREVFYPIYEDVTQHDGSYVNMR